jgi:hypothetical protein
VYFPLEKSLSCFVASKPGKVFTKGYLDKVGNGSGCPDWTQIDVHIRKPLKK